MAFAGLNSKLKHFPVPQVIEHGEGGQRYSVVTGEAGPEGRRFIVSVVSKKLDSHVEVQPRMTASIKIITGKK